MPRPENVKKVTRMSVDFSTAGERREGGGTQFHGPEQDYLLKVKEASFGKVKPGGQNAGQPQVTWTLEVVDPKQYAGKGVVYYRTGCWPEAVFSFRNILEDLRDGKKIKLAPADVDLTKYFGKEIGASLVDDDPYNGKVKSKVAYTYPASQYKAGDAEAEDDEDETEDDEEELETTDDDDEDAEDEDDDL